MTKSEIIFRICELSPRLDRRDVERIVATVFDGIGSALASGNRVGQRKARAFFVKHRSGRIGRTPSAGDPVEVLCKTVPSQRTGEQLRAYLDGADSTAEPATASDEKAQAGIRVLAGGWSSLTKIEPSPMGREPGPEISRHREGRGGSSEDPPLTVASGENEGL